MKNDEGLSNPWYVSNLDEFLYFCCPECDERNQSKDLFLRHAFDQHPKSKECFQNFLIKEEDYDEKDNLNTNDNNSYNDLDYENSVR